MYKREEQLHPLEYQTPSYPTEKVRRKKTRGVVGQGILKRRARDGGGNLIGFKK